MIGTTGCSGTLLPHRLGMGRAAITIVALLGATLPSLGSNVRPASEPEMLGLLRGCWREELDLKLVHLGWREDVCFGLNGKVVTPMVTCSEEHGCSSARGRGTYSVADDKLNLSTDQNDDGWIFGRAVLSCDVLIRPSRAFRLMNCIDPEWAGDYPDRSFSWLAAEEMSE